MESSEKTLILGCGKRPAPGAVNHDLHKHSPQVDIAHDLNVLPWPWEDEEFDKVVAWAVLEHLHIDRMAIMNELWRILKPGCVATVKLPHWKSDIAWWDMTHYWMVSVETMDQLDPDTKRGQDYDFYTPYKWTVLQKKLNNAKSSVIFKLRKRALDEQHYK